MTRSYIETAEGHTLTAAQAYDEIRVRHGQDAETWREFLDEFGVCDEYDATEVLEWLGY